MPAALADLQAMPQSLRRRVVGCLVVGQGVNNGLILSPGSSGGLSLPGFVSKHQARCTRPLFDSLLLARSLLLGGSYGAKVMVPPIATTGHELDTRMRLQVPSLWQVCSLAGWPLSENVAFSPGR